MLHARFRAPELPAAAFEMSDRQPPRFPPPAPWANLRLPGRQLLYRGSLIDKAMLRVGTTSRERAYSSFTRDQNAAVFFLQRAAQRLGKTKYKGSAVDPAWPGHRVEPGVLRLDVRDVQRGTPWIWFQTGDHDDVPLRSRNLLPSRHPGESEVLLPPGTFAVTRVTALRNPDYGWMTPVLVVDVRFTPDAAFTRGPRRKGAPSDWDADPLPPLF